MNTRLALYAVISVVKPTDRQGKEYENYPIVNKLACLVCILKGLCLLVFQRFWNIVQMMIVWIFMTFEHFYRLHQ